MAYWNGLVLYTVGHSTRTLDDLVDLLRTFSVAALVDVRTIPRSRHNPQFNADALETDLPQRSIAYCRLAALGGLRKARADSPNDGWRNASFRGFADYMQSDAFEQGLDELWCLARASTAAIMCAEAVPWRCHRSLIADALLVRGTDVRHITGRRPASPHRLTSFAQVRSHRITYPANPGDS